MGHYLFWLEASVTSILLVALGMRIAWRVPRSDQRWIPWIEWSLTVLAPLIVAYGIFLFFCFGTEVFDFSATTGRAKFYGMVAGAAYLFIAYVSMFFASRRIAVFGVWIQLVVLPWLLTILYFIAIQQNEGGAVEPMFSALVAGGTFVVIALAVFIRGLMIAPENNLRRAPTWRLIRLGPACAVALLLVVMTFWNLLLDVEREMSTYRVEAGTIANAASPPRIPDSINAAALYRQARSNLYGERIRGISWTGKVHDWLHPRKGDFDPDNKEMLAFLQKHRSTRTILHKATERQYCNFGTDYQKTLYYGWHSRLFGYREWFDNFLCLSARVNAAQGNMSAAIKDLNACFAMVDHFLSEPISDGTRAAFDVEMTAFKTFQYILQQGQLNQENLDKLHLNPYLNFQSAVQRNYRMKKASGLSIFTSRYLFERLSEYSMVGFGENLYYVFLSREDVKIFLRYIKRHEELVEQPYYENIPEWQRLQKELEAKQRLGLMPNEFLYNRARWAKWAAEAEAHHRLALLGTAMLQYRFDKDEFPERLDQLVPSYLINLPADPFTGEQMKMIKADKQTIIYSIGADLKDQGGAPLPGGRWVEIQPGDIRFVLGD
jgi:hypothetical protein